MNSPVPQSQLKSPPQQQQMKIPPFSSAHPTIPSTTTNTTNTNHTNTQTMLLQNERTVIRRAGKTAIRNFLASHTCFSMLRHSGKVVVFDTRIPLQLAFYALVEHDMLAAPLWDPLACRFVGILTVSDFIDMLLHYHETAQDVSTLASGSIAEILTTNTTATATLHSHHHQNPSHHSNPQKPPHASYPTLPSRAFHGADSACSLHQACQQLLSLRERKKQARYRYRRNRRQPQQERNRPPPQPQQQSMMPTTNSNPSVENEESEGMEAAAEKEDKKNHHPRTTTTTTTTPTLVNEEPMIMAHGDFLPIVFAEDMRVLGCITYTHILEHLVTHFREQRRLFDDTLADLRIGTYYNDDIDHDIHESSNNDNDTDNVATAIDTMDDHEDIIERRRSSRSRSHNINNRDAEEKERDEGADDDDYDYYERSTSTHSTVISATPRESLASALRKMKHHGLSALPVIDHETSRKLVGVYARSDITFLTTASDAEDAVRNLNLPLQEVMSSLSSTCSHPNDSASGSGSGNMDMGGSGGVGVGHIASSSSSTTNTNTATTTTTTTTTTTMTPDALRTCSLHHTLQAIFESFASMRFNRLYVIDENETLLGVVSAQDLVAYFLSSSSSLSEHDDE